MKFPSRQQPLDGLPGVSGTARVDRRTSAVVRRLRRGDIAVIDHLDLDRSHAEALVDAGVVAVVNASAFISGRYPNLGPELLARAGVLMLDDVGAEVFKAVSDGADVRVDGHRLMRGEETLAEGRLLTADDVAERMSDARGGLSTQLQSFTPTVSEHGWSAGGHTVVEVVTDDMPFLVDSVTMELTENARDVHMVVHPQLLVRRDMTGELQDILVDDEMTPSADLPHDVFRESWMHIEIDRETDREQVAELEQSLSKVLLDVREAVEDWERMRAQAREIVDDLDREPPPLPDGEVEEGKALLEWLADDHFTFLGYREYRLEGEGDDVVLRAVPGTGFGILRSDQDMSTSFGKLPPIVRAKAREKTLLVLAKANSKATVHRPVYLDYVGVKTFDKDGEVVGERRFLGLFSSAAYTESLTRIPVIRQKAQEVIDRAGFE